MVTWTAPLREYRFVRDELFGSTEGQSIAGHAELAPDLADTILAEAGRFCAEVLLPLNQSGDREGCRIEAGRVRTPAGFVDAYRRYSAGGWTSMAADPKDGGQGLPHMLVNFVEEMTCSANHAFALYPGLTNGAYEAIRGYAPAELQARYLPKIVSGEWLGTMNLTEPQSGTDLALTRTRAAAQPDGTYRITGTKMFISGGDHDLTENIVHLVLARLPDAPAGTRGISMFLVPRLLPDADGAAGQPNQVSCGSIEHKMGLRGSATCVMNFDGATGWLIGEPNKGLNAMFTMMNAARLGVAVQGVGLAETALQSATSYAKERLQGRALGERREGDRPADPLIVHPDIRRMLLTMRANVEGGRALCAWIGQSLDVAHHASDVEARLAASELVSLLTPVAKAFVTDLAFECCVTGQQIFGGHGYISEWGMEQLVRDARVTQIYEGANGIQALDLAGRKLRMEGGRLPLRFFDPVQSYLEAASDRPGAATFARPALAALDQLRQATRSMTECGDTARLSGATEYLRLFGLVALGYLWTRAGEVAAARQAGPEASFYRRKLATARFYVNRMLPQTLACAAIITADSSAVAELSEADF
jgi:butyryl-CoA dehydrogenase